MSKLLSYMHGKPLSADSRAVMVQVGWLGGSGEVYPLDEPPTMPQQEKASYQPLYIQIGEWKWNELSENWYIQD